MSQQVKIILMDDIHTEGRIDAQNNEFKEEVIRKINSIKNEGYLPVVVCAGDIGERTKGLEWMKDFPCDVVYTCGNHEFWNQDYNEVYNAIKTTVLKPEYSHIKFLDRNSYNIGGVRFLGATLWTGLGFFMNWYENKNMALKYFPIMGDFKKIKIKGWYTPENIKRFKDFMYDNIKTPNELFDEAIEGMIQNEFFNPLFELEEHKKALKYIDEELNNPFDGKTVVVTHHLPDHNLWAKAKGMNKRVLQGEYLNNDRLLHEGARGQNKMYRDAMLIGFYSNDLSYLMNRKNAPDYWLHGHLHIPVTDMVGKTKVISAPSGYHSQSADLLMREFVVHDDERILLDIIDTKVKEFNWEDMNKLLQELESAIKTFEPLVKGNFVKYEEFEPIFTRFKRKHQENVDELKLYLTKTLSPLAVLKDKSLEKDTDYFNVIVKSGVLSVKYIGNSGEEIKYKIPDYITSEIDEKSFVFRLSEVKNNDVRFWMVEIHKIQAQIKNIQKVLNELTKK